MRAKNILQDMEKYFPLLQHIDNKALAEKVANVWHKLWKESRWKKMEDALWNPILCPGVRLIDHTNSVTRAAMQFSQIRSEIYGEEYNNDILLAGAILHDSSKILEVDPDGKTGSTSKRGRLFQHGFLGAHMAVVENLPDEVVHIIISHTGQSRLLPKTREAILIYALDLADADINRLNAQSPLLLEKHK
jgi:putative nucleotidyltransferase with HDIG domain